mgnify:CR=1 FL=1
MHSLAFVIVATYCKQVEGHLSTEFGFLDKPLLISYKIVWHIYTCFSPQIFLLLIQIKKNLMKYYLSLITFNPFFTPIKYYYLQIKKKVKISNFLFFFDDISLFLNFIQVRRP